MLQVLLAVSMLAFDTNGNNLKCFPNKPPSGGLFISNEYLLGVQQLPNLGIFSTILAYPLNTFDETKPAGRSKLLNYFIEHKLKNLMDVIEEF